MRTFALSSDLSIFENLRFLPVHTIRLHLRFQKLLLLSAFSETYIFNRISIAERQKIIEKYVFSNEMTELRLTKLKAVLKQLFR